MKLRFLLGLSMAIFYLMTTACSNEEQNHTTISKRDKDKIRALATDIPLILANQGWEPYEQCFDAEYRNWSMARNNVRSRSEYLGLVKQWYEDGNKATASQVYDVEFIPLSDDLVMYLHVQREDFSNDDGEDVGFREISFVSIYKRTQDDSWQVYFTGFMDRPQE